MLVLLTTRAILRDISDVLMERVPRAHDSTAVEAALLQVPPVRRRQQLVVCSSAGACWLAASAAMGDARGSRVGQCCREAGLAHATSSMGGC